jgi:hypothetical protein
MRSPHPQFVRGSPGGIKDDGANKNTRLIFALRTGRDSQANHSSSIFQVLDLCEK